MPRNDHARLLHPRDFGDQTVFEVRVLDLQVHPLQRLHPLPLLRTKLCRLGIHIDFEHDPQQDEGQDDPHHRQGIGRRIGQRRQRHQVQGRARRSQSLLCCPEGRRIRRRPGKQAGHRRQRHLQHPAAQAGYQNATRHQQEGVTVQDTSLFPQRRKKARPHLHSQRKDEQHQPELLQEMRHLSLGPKSEMGCEQARKQHPGHPQLHPRHADVPQTDPTQHHDTENEQIMRHGGSFLNLLEEGHASSIGTNNATCSTRLCVNSVV